MTDSITALSPQLSREERDAEIVRRLPLRESLECIDSDFGPGAGARAPDRRGGELPGAQLRADQRTRAREVRRERCLAPLDQRPGLTADERSRDLAVPRAQVLAALGRDGRRLLGVDPRALPRVPDDELLGKVRLAAELVSGPLTGGAYAGAPASSSAGSADPASTHARGTTQSWDEPLLVRAA